MIPTKEQNSNVPVKENEIIEQVHQAYELGITIAHLHARDELGKPTYKKSAYQTILEGVRKHCPDLIVCTSLSGRNFNEFEKRSAPLELAPDMASLTLSSLNFVAEASMNKPDMIQRLAEKMDHFGVKPELEVFDLGMLNYGKYLIQKGLIHEPFYFNIILGNIASAQFDPSHIAAMLCGLPPNAYWAFGGIGKFQLPANMNAISLGGGVRVGLEDNIYFDQNKQELASNLDLLKRIHQIIQLSGKEIMPSRELGSKGFYNKNRRIT